MKLIDIRETYERTYTETEEDPKPIFTLRKLTYGEMSNISDETQVLDEKNRLIFRGGTSTRLKIKYSLVGWKNITDNDGKEVPCNEANKEKLPPSVAIWLVREIDELNKLRGIPEEERKNL